MSKWHPTRFCENCAKEWCCTNECKYHLLHRIKKAREEVEGLCRLVSMTNPLEITINRDAVLQILDKLITEAEE